MGKHNQIWMTAGYNAIKVAAVPLKSIISRKARILTLFLLVLTPAMLHTLTKSSCIQKLEFDNQQKLARRDMVHGK